MKSKLICVVFMIFLMHVAWAQGSSLFTEDSISFTTPKGNYKIAGTLSYPSGKSKCPSVILIWGSGPHTRDQVVSGFPMFRIIAERLNELGFAVLRIDKRSFGLSEGPDKSSEQFTTTAELADDIYIALQELKKHKAVDINRIGLIGHSEGAWIAQMVAQRDSSVKFMGLLGAPVIKGSKRQSNLMCANLLKLGAKPEVVEKVRVQIDRYFDFIQEGYKDDSVYYEIGRDFLLAHGMEEKDVTNEVIDKYIDGFKTPWNQYYLSGTPSELIAEIKLPMFFIYGGDDVNVKPDEEFTELSSAIRKSKNQNVSITVLSGLDHFFQVKSENGKWGLSERLLDSMSLWLKYIMQN